MGLIIAGFVWGFSEATLFFLVPDILLSWVILKKRKSYLPVYTATLCGALPGGIVMYYWGSIHPDTIKAILDRVPAISENLIHKSYLQLQQAPLANMIRGSFSGVPYKLYAAQAGIADIPLMKFLALSIPARLLRWITVGLTTYCIDRFVLNRFPEQEVTAIFIFFWFSFYSIYFLSMTN